MQLPQAGQPAGEGLAALLVFADGRFPSGGYAHSGGLESAVRRGWVRDLSDLRGFLLGRASTTGLMNASFAVAAHRSPTPDTLRTLDDELRARTPSPVMRQVSVDLGRMMLRAGQSMAPGTLLDGAPQRLQHPLVYGLLARALGAGERAAAAAVLHETVTGPATAAVKLMHIDPFAAHRAVLDLTSHLDRLAERAVLHACADPAALPAPSSPLSDMAAEHHHQDDARLFAS